MAKQLHADLVERRYSETDSRRLISTEELSRLLGISMSTLTKWRLTGQGPKFVKLGARVGYRQSDIDEFTAGRVRRSTSDAA